VPAGLQHESMCTAAQKAARRTRAAEALADRAQALPKTLSRLVCRLPHANRSLKSNTELDIDSNPRQNRDRKRRSGDTSDRGGRENQQWQRPLARSASLSLYRD